MGLENLHTIFRPNQPGLKKVLGDLEAEIMEVVWATDANVSARDVHPVLLTGRSLSYTTVVCTMTALVKKGMLRIVARESRAHIYRATVSREEFLQSVLGRVLDNIFEDFPDTAAALLDRRRVKGQLEDNQVLVELGERLERLKREEEL